jgi:hypothetical protein
MGAMVINSGGLGQTASEDAAECVSAGYASYLFNPSCWGQSYADWQAQFYGTGATGASSIAIQAPAAPSVPASLTTLPDTTGDTAQDLSNAALAATQVATAIANPATADACQTFSNNWPYPFGNTDCPTMMLYGALLLGAILIVPRLIK